MRVFDFFRNSISIKTRAFSIGSSPPKSPMASGYIEKSSNFDSKANFERGPLRNCFILLAVFCAFAGAPPKREAKAPLATKLPANGPMIVIDPGHGGLDIGAKAKDPYCEEKKLTLSTSRFV